MSHQVLSRKYRPQAFDQLVGQEHVGRILRNAIQSGRVGHAYLFVGPRGVGKTTTARIFAKALNCRAATGEHGTPDPCGVCPSCLDVTQGIDLDVVEMDAASNNQVDDVRRLREQVGYATVRSRYRIWIVDEVHMLSAAAFNAFLKTLEEPPEGVKFIFCTTEEHKLPDTIRSRCQRVEFRAIQDAAMVGRLRELAAQEGVEVEEGLLEDVAAAALGGLRDAESLLEQLIAASEGGRISRGDLDHLAGRAPRARLDALLEAIDEGDAGRALDALDACLASGAKPGVLLEQWMDRLRQRLLDAAHTPTDERGGRGVAGTARALDVLLDKRVHLRGGAEGTLVCQVAAVELARLPDARDLDRLLAALEGAGGGAVPAAGAMGGGTSETSGPPAVPRRRPASGARGTSGGHDRPAVRDGDKPAPPSAAVVARRWREVVEATAGRDARLAEALSRSRPGDVSDGRLEVLVPPGERLAQSALGRREAVLAFRGVAEQVFGVPLAPRVVIDEGFVSPPQEPERVAPNDHPVVRLVAEKTRGHLLNIEKTPPSGPERS